MHDKDCICDPVEGMCDYHAAIDITRFRGERFMKNWEIQYKGPSEAGAIQLGVIVPSKLTQKTLDAVCEYVNGFKQQAPVIIELVPRNELDEFSSY